MRPGSELQGGVRLVRTGTQTTSGAQDTQKVKQAASGIGSQAASASKAGETKFPGSDCGLSGFL